MVKGEEGLDSRKHHLVCLNPEYIVFGNGRHAWCAQLSIIGSSASSTAPFTALVVSWESTTSRWCLYISFSSTTFSLRMDCWSVLQIPVSPRRPSQTRKLNWCSANGSYPSAKLDWSRPQSPYRVHGIIITARIIRPLIPISLLFAPVSQTLACSVGGYLSIRSWLSCGEFDWTSNPMLRYRVALQWQ